MRVVVITPPVPVISMMEAKDHLGVDDDNDIYNLMNNYLEAATAHIDAPDGWLGRAIGSQVLEARFDTAEVARGDIRLPFPPVIDLVSITWSGPDRAPQTVDLAEVELLGDVVAPIGPTPWAGMRDGREVLRIQYQAGYSDPPAPIRAAILLMMGDLYQNRETVTASAAVKVPMSTTVTNLLSPYRVWR